MQCCVMVSVCVLQAASFWWAKGGPIDGRGGTVADGETATTTASDPEASNLNVV